MATPACVLFSPCRVSPQKVLPLLPSGGRFSFPSREKKEISSVAVSFLPPEQHVELRGEIARAAGLECITDGGRDRSQIDNSHQSLATIVSEPRKGPSLQPYLCHEDGPLVSLLAPLVLRSPLESRLLRCHNNMIGGG